MGTLINLSLGSVEVDWGKNNFYTDHGSLFQTGDRSRVPTRYASPDWPNGEPLIEWEDGFSKSLRDIRDRLELMGHTVRTAFGYYAHLSQASTDDGEAVSFSELAAALSAMDVNRFTGNYRDDYKPGQFVREEIIERLAEVSGRFSLLNSGPKSDHYELDLILEQLGPFNTLRLLAENPANLDLKVTWNFGALVESGWATTTDFVPGARVHDRFLVVTEGSSDAKILRKALELYRPHVADFFYFIDMEEGYPFSGTGNLYRFAQGLVSIGVLNNTVIVYDNDAEGLAKHSLTNELKLPPNMRAMKLPDVREFEEFETIGPTGVVTANINGKAAAIECYLDLLYESQSSPQVRWIAFNREAGTYQGELVGKTQYMKNFLELRTRAESYDSRKLELILSALISECVSIAEANASVGLSSTCDSQSPSAF